MANSLTFTTPAGDNVTFTLTAATAGQAPAFAAQFTTAFGGILYLKVYETGDSSNPITDYATLVEGKLYDIEAYSDASFTTPVDIADGDWSGSNVTFAGHIFTPDRRPIYQAGLATQTTTYQNIAANTATFGVNQVNYRKTGATGNNADSTTNGRLKWIEDKVLHTCDDTYASNFDRFHFTNIAGHTSINKGNQQPHFTSGAYQCLNLDQAKYFNELSGTVANEAALPVASATFNNEFYRTTDNDHLFCCVNAGGYTWVDMGAAAGFDGNRPYFLMDSPFTDTGVPSGTLGDSVDAWTEAITQFRTAATPTNLEITSYQGYRPVFNGSTGYVPFDHQAEKVISLSKQSSNTVEPSWQGQDNGDPAYCPEPGFDGSDSSVWVPRFASYFDKEIAGIFSLGFDGIGLDTGTRVWDNAEGRANGSGTQVADGTGSSGIVDFFNGFGMKPVFEAVGLDTWSAGDGPYPAVDSRYAASAYWAYFGSWWNWNNGSDYDETGSGGKVYYNGGSQVVGDPATGGAAFNPSTSEVHCIFQWPATNTQSAGSAGTVAYILEEYGFLRLKQCMYDFHAAGIIASAAGSKEDFTAHASTTNSGEQFAAADFYNFVLDLASGAITSRPAPDTLLARVDTTTKTWGSSTNWLLQTNLNWTSEAAIVTEDTSVMDYPSISKVYLKRSFSTSTDFSNPLSITFGVAWSSIDPGADANDWHAAVTNPAIVNKEVFAKLYVESDGNPGTWNLVGTSEYFLGVSATQMGAPFNSDDPNVLNWQDAANNWINGDGQERVGDWYKGCPVRIELWQKG